MNLNKAFLIGRLTRNPETKSLPSGQPVTSFGMATDRFYYDKSGGRQQKTEFHNIVIFGKLADIASQYLLKGSLVYIEGRIQNRTWKDPSGNQRNRTEVVAERMQLGPRSAKREVSEPVQKPEETPTEEIPIIEEEGDKEIDISKIPF
jgi:single-strand DNA-binding protein